MFLGSLSEGLSNDSGNALLAFSNKDESKRQGSTGTQFDWNFSPQNDVVKDILDVRSCFSSISNTESENGTLPLDYWGGVTSSMFFKQYESDVILVEDTRVTQTNAEEWSCLDELSLIIIVWHNLIVDTFRIPEIEQTETGNCSNLTMFLDLQNPRLFLLLTWLILNNQGIFLQTSIYKSIDIGVEEWCNWLR